MNTKDIFKHRPCIKLCILLLFVGFGLILQGCYPADSISVSETDIVTTFKDADADFVTKITYYLEETVHRPESDEPPEPTPELDAEILDAIDRNMVDSGFEKTLDRNLADVVVGSMVNTTLWVSTGQDCYYWYWGYYPGWCYPTVNTYETGTLFIIMIDPVPDGEEPSPENTLWVAMANGLLGSSSSTEFRINRDIDQAFVQSPYLSDGKN